MLEKVKEILEKCAEEVEVKIEKYTRFRRDLIAPGIEWWWQESLAIVAKDGVFFEFDLSDSSDYIWELALPDRVAKYDERKKEDWTRLERDVLSLVAGRCVSSN